MSTPNSTPPPAAEVAGNLPVPFEHQPGLRALVVYRDVPAGHLTLRVEDESFAPHLQRGEFAVVDLADRTPAAGELFVMGYRHRLDTEDRFLRLRVMQLRVKEGLWWAIPQWPIRSREELLARMRAGTVAGSDGPYDKLDHLSSYLVGRVVGVFVPTRGRASA